MALQKSLQYLPNSLGTLTEQGCEIGVVSARRPIFKALVHQSIVLRNGNNQVGESDLRSLGIRSPRTNGIPSRVTPTPGTLVSSPDK
jgi:hypothetical protein